MTAQIVDTTHFSLNFPQAPEKELLRDNLVATIDNYFKGGANVIVVEGAEGIGKTTLLAQFVKENSDHSISLFIRPLNRLSVNPSSFKFDMAEQIHWILNSKPLSVEDVNDAQYAQLLTRLRRRANFRNERFFFVIDGISDLAQEDAQVKDILFDQILNIGVPQFCFLLSGKTEDVPKTIREATSLKSLILPPFSLTETREYLNDLSIDSTQVENLHRMCSKGFPAYLAAIRREIDAGMSADELLDQDPTKLHDFLTLEWKHLENLDDWQELVLSALAFSHSEFTLSELASIVSVVEEDVTSFFHNVRIVEVADGRATFLTESHRNFAQQRLGRRSQEVIELIIKFLTEDTQDVRSLETLSDYYQRSGRFTEIIDYLTPEVFLKMLRASGSLYPLRRQTQLGIDAAQHLGFFESTLGYCFQQATLREINRAEVWRSEVEARVALEDYPAALSLAQSALLREDKLQLLAVVTRKQIEQGLNVDSEIKDQIYALAKQLPTETLESKVLDIATDLVKLDPDLSIDLVEGISKAGGKSDSLDWAFAKLSAAATSTEDTDNETQGTAERVRSRIQNPKIKEFISAISIFTEGYSAREVIEQVKKLELKNRLFILRRWAVVNNKRADAGIVINAALNLLVESSTEYIPKTRDLREIASPIVSVSLVEEVQKLIQTFDAIKGTVRELGATVDYVRLELYLAEAEAAYSTQAATDRLLTLFWLISELEDVSLRAHCLAYFVAQFALIDKDGSIERKEGLLEVTKEKFESDIDFLLSQTANHYEVIEGPLKALSQSNPHFATALALRLNRSDRREQAIEQFLALHLDLPINEVHLDLIKQVWQQNIANIELRSETLWRILKKLASEAEGILESQINTVLALINNIDNLPQAADRCICQSYAIAILAKQRIHEYHSLRNTLLGTVRVQWEAIDVEWFKIDIGFRVAKILAEVEPDVARAFLEKTEKAREAVAISAPETGGLILSCLRLLIRAFSGLLRNRLEQLEDIQALSKLIDQVPARCERIGIWSELVLRCYNCERTDLGSDVVKRYIQPLLNNISELDKYASYRALITAAPALFIYHRDTALELFDKLPLPEREEAYGNICHFLLFRSSPDEPYKDAGHVTKELSHQTATDLCRVLELAEREDLLARFIPQLAKHLAEKFTGSRVQRAAIYERLLTIINEKLPDIENIKHDGYKIMLKAYLLLAREDAKGPDWDTIIQDAENIPNASDKAFVLSNIAYVLPSKFSGKRSQVIERVVTVIEEIPNALDKADRYIILADDIRQNDKNSAKKHLSTALQSTYLVNESSRNYSLQRRAIDIAHSIDPDFAASLATLYDDDPTREVLRQELKEQLGILNTKNKMINQGSTSDSDISPEQYAHAAWLTLGSLNANRVETLHLDHLRKYVDVSQRLPLALAYPIFSWVIENTVRRYDADPNKKHQLVETFRAVLRGSHFAINLLNVTLNSSKQLLTLESELVPLSSLVITDGQRNEALQWLKQWLENSAEEHLIICDPYFGPNDLDVLMLINSAKPGLRVKILTSREHLKKKQIDGNLDDAFSHAWEKLSDQAPPPTTIKVAGLRSNHSLPIHDRWWLTKSGGLRIGTSLQSLGIGKTTEISLLTQDEAINIESSVITPYLQEQPEVGGERLKYISFNL